MFLVFDLLTADEKIPLNKNQLNLVNEFIFNLWIFFVWANILKELVKTSNEKTEYYDRFIYNLVERLILVGDLKDWFDYKDLIENHIESRLMKPTSKYTLHPYGAGDCTPLKN